jgi:hypothetical protein
MSKSLSLFFRIFYFNAAACSYFCCRVDARQGISVKVKQQQQQQNELHAVDHDSCDGIGIPGNWRLPVVRSFSLTNKMISLDDQWRYSEDCKQQQLKTSYADDWLSCKKVKLNTGN